jgi:hypothetical protein
VIDDPFIMLASDDSKPFKAPDLGAGAGAEPPKRATKRVFIIRGESEGYVVECCVNKRPSVCAAAVRRWVAWDRGRVEWRRVEMIAGSSWWS